MTTAFVLSGGGSLGAVQAGMLTEVLRAGVRPDLIVGVSAGAINGAYLAADPSQSHAEKLADLWSRLRAHDVFGGRLSAALRMLKGHESLAPARPLRELLVRNLTYPLIQSARTRLCVIASDQLTGEEVALTQGDLVDAVLASAAIPGVFPPVKIGSRLLVDGAIASGTPIGTAVALGADRLVVMPCGFTCVSAVIPRRPLGRAVHALTLIAAQRLRVEYERYRDQVTICIVPPLCPMDRAAHDYSAGAKLVESARRSTRDWIARGGLERSELPPTLEQHTH